jgi:eukaryotic-like serine/threonine-protein kinase
MPTQPDSENAPPSTLDESLVGQRVHKYDIVRVIGRGGMGMVYEALNTTISKRVAMKFVDAEMARNKDAVARFQREAQAASAVESAHIVEIFDSGTSDQGQPFIVMELLRGEDLGHRIKRCGRLELPEAVHVIAQILRGLHRAHAAGIVHRDLKPDNVFLVDRDDDQNFAKILDFGISKVQRTGDVPVNTLTRQGTVLGTPFYMSPEQAQAMSDIDGRTDLWSVGAILYECLTGRPPYTGTTYEQVIINICMKDAEDVRMHNPAVPEGVAAILTKALSREREHRFSTAREFLDALVSATGGLISSRRSGDDLLNPPTPSPSFVPGKTPEGPQGPGAFENTVEVNPGTSKVGWSTSGRRVGGRERKRFVVVGAVALALGGVSGLFYMRQRAPATLAVGSTVESPAQAAPRQEDARPAEARTAASPQATATGSVQVEPAQEATAAPTGSADEPKSEPTAKSKGGRGGPPRGGGAATKKAGPPATAPAVAPSPAKGDPGVAPSLKVKVD